MIDLDTLARRVKDACSTKHCGQPSSLPPQPETVTTPGDPFEPGFVFQTGNHGYELWVGYASGAWLFHCRRETAARLARFIVWDWWIAAEWCGLKRWLFYRALSVAVRRYRRPSC